MSVANTNICKMIKMALLKIYFRVESDVSVVDNSKSVLVFSVGHVQCGQSVCVTV